MGSMYGEEVMEDEDERARRGVALFVGSGLGIIIVCVH